MFIFSLMCLVLLFCAFCAAGRNRGRRTNWRRTLVTATCPPDQQSPYCRYMSLLTDILTSDFWHKHLIPHSYCCFVAYKFLVAPASILSVIVYLDSFVTSFQYCSLNPARNVLELEAQVTALRVSLSQASEQTDAATARASELESLIVCTYSQLCFVS